MLGLPVLWWTDSKLPERWVLGALGFYLHRSSAFLHFVCVSRKLKLSRVIEVRPRKLRHLRRLSCQTLVDWNTAVTEEVNSFASRKWNLAMPNSLASLQAAALMLAPDERAVLADHLLASLAVEQEVDEAWAVEVERRIAEIESGQMQLVPVEEAIARAKHALA